MSLSHCSLAFEMHPSHCDVVVQGTVIRVFMIGFKGNCCALHWLYLLHLFTLLFSIPPHLYRPTAGKLSRAEYSAVSSQKRWDRWFLPAKSKYSFRPCLHGINMWSGVMVHHLYLVPNSSLVTICDRVALSGEIGWGIWSKNISAGYRYRFSDSRSKVLCR